MTKRAVDLAGGRAFVVTDLHGAWDAYARYRDHFLRLYDRGDADQLIFLGDLVHGYGPPEEDHSLSILWDIMELEASLGQSTVMVLLGNHELPHIYGVMLSKGDMAFTPRLEHALGEYRGAVIDFFNRMPFLIRSPGGVMLTHAGAAPSTATPAAAARLLDFSHRELWQEADDLLSLDNVAALINTQLNMTVEAYERMAWEALAVTGPSDPRYLDLLRGFIVSSLQPEWPLLWDFFFSQCEGPMGPRAYGKVLERFLEVYEAEDAPQQVLLTGHIPVRGGYQVIAGRQLRLASWAHATPREEGCYLLFDVSKPVRTAEDLIGSVHRMPL